MRCQSFIRKALLCCALFSMVNCSSYGPPHAGEKIHRNVLFASPNGHDLKMDLYVPETPGPAPVVIWIFGGSWKFGSKGYHVNIRDLTQSGIAVASIQYRLSGNAKYPAQLEDCSTAVQWLRTNSHQFGLDPSRIGVSGESAGGHLAALVGLVEATPGITAVCVLYPPTDLVTLGRKYSKPVEASDIEKLLGGPIEKKLKLASAASPINHASSDSPPFLIFHGAKDKLVPLEQSQSLQRRLTDAGVESQLVIVPDKGHWFQLDSMQLDEVGRFFNKHFAAAPTR